LIVFALVAPNRLLGKNSGCARDAALNAVKPAAEGSEWREWVAILSQPVAG
jgi:hypothetical protein